jgi:hypothetical protein
MGMGQFALGNVVINIYSLCYYNDRPAAAASIPCRYGIRGLHETIHKAGKGWGYDDDHLKRQRERLSLMPNTTIGTQR